MAEVSIQRAMTRFFLPLTCTAFDYFPNLRAVGAQAEVLGQYFEEKLSFAKVASAAMSPTKDEAHARIHGWLMDGARSDSDVLVLYMATHGIVSEFDDDLYLCWRESDPGRRSSMLSMAELAALVGMSRVRRCLIVLDCCYAGAGAADLATGVRGTAAVALCDPTQEER